jgi:cytochrome c peroxidase
MRIGIRAAATLAAVLVLTATSMSGVARQGAGTAARDRWIADEVRVLASLRLSELPPQPEDPSNAFAASPAAAAFGKRLFNDARFSGNGAVSCASCHAPEKQFQDGLPVGKGVATGKRRTMPIAGATYSPWLFWDGRKDSLWSQALGPLEDAAEHGGNRARFAHLIRTHYRSEYESVFGPLPDLARVPAEAGPLGTPAERSAWDRLDSGSRQDVSRVFANIGKAIAAYERTLNYGESRFDRYAQGVVDGNASAQEALTPKEVRGLRLFIGKGQCATCHNGPMLTDQHFHNTGVPARDPNAPDRGRAEAVAKVQHDEFNCLGPFSDTGAGKCDELRFIVTDDPTLLGAFRTPSLRNVALRPPYMHAGQFATLEEAIAHYDKAPAAAVGHSELARGAQGHTERKPIRLSAAEIEELAAFLRALSAPIAESPAR